MRRLGAAALTLGAALLLAGCGLGAGPSAKGVRLQVTRDFGATVLSRQSAPKVGGQETVMQLLERNHHVKTRFGGGFVQSIDGLAGGEEDGHRVDWFYYVNGVEAPKGAASTEVHGGDRVWWDHHDWSATDSIPAVVGSFPEPFLNGLEGKRLPVRVECTEVTGSACKLALKRLQDLQIPAAVSAAAGATGEFGEALRLLVGPWAKIGSDRVAGRLSAGPRASGVYAKPEGSRALALLNAEGQTVRTLEGEAGLIAATREGENDPVWVITGTDVAAVNLAAQDFDASHLENHFALAVTSREAVPLPVAGP